jgi:hypothetical protein
VKVQTYSGSGSSQDSTGGMLTQSCSIAIPKGYRETIGGRGPLYLPVVAPKRLNFSWTLGELRILPKAPPSGCSTPAPDPSFNPTYALPYPSAPDMNGLFSDEETAAFSYGLADSIDVPLSEIDEGQCDKSVNFVLNRTNYAAPSTPNLLQTIALKFDGQITIEKLNGKRETQNRRKVTCT